MSSNISHNRSGRKIKSIKLSEDGQCTIEFAGSRSIAARTLDRTFSEGKLVSVLLDRKITREDDEFCTMLDEYRTHVDFAGCYVTNIVIHSVG